MHFTVLSALRLPQDIPAAETAIPVDEVVGFIERNMVLEHLYRKEPMITPKVDAAMIGNNRWECLVERMVDNLLAPYNENTEDTDNMEFTDRTNEGRRAYEQSGADCVKTPDGRIIFCYEAEFNRRYELHDGKVYRRRFGPLHHRKQTKKSKRYLALPNYPFRKLFPTVAAFMTECWGCVAGEEDGHYGYYFNPNGQWDWWQIGGRWPFRFLVKNDCTLAIAGDSEYLFRGEPRREAPEGYRWVAGARKCDIAWDVMREFMRSQHVEQFRQYVEWFSAGAIPKDQAGYIKLVADGIVSLGDYLYHKGEDLEHYLYNSGLSDQHPYTINTFACVDADGWNDQGWGMSDRSEDDTQAWFKEVTDFIAKQPNDAFLVSVDCHT